ncbi:flagellar assembly protein FliH [Sinobaca qinghaiensis]|uniref:Flagellar assembly protein FliH n=1 Tax=Sinobaca qinghaiensis TaxID=342944 RepID=A0A419V5V6_9BACL|nr:flagellar assembly protein FliH [Sinobaca qinghaiensis]RKD75372.1 flagellar assembly protein FliH [Sinobaca qinghaiensis]
MSRVIKETHALYEASERSIAIHASFIPEKQTTQGSSVLPEIHRTRIRARQVEADARAKLEQAERELEQVRFQISREEEDSKAGIQQAYEDAKQAGAAEGFAEGYETGKKSWEEEIDKAGRVVQSSRVEKEAYLEASEGTILKLAMAVAERMLGKSVLQDETLWVDLVKQALIEVKEEKEITIYVAPDQYDITVDRKDEIEAVLYQNQQLWIVPSHQLEQNQCYIETPFGRVNASLDTQFAEIKQQLEKLLEEGAADESHSTAS